ncbi:MAG: hypothetical protein ACPG19_06205 [Saprospiraceae bacterium]
MKQSSIVFTILFILAFSHSSFAQIDSIYPELKNTFFVYLIGGKIIEGEQVTFRDPLLKRPYINVDDLEIRAKEVQFYQDEFGFHANVSSLLGPFNLKTSFAPRIKAGKINLYELIRINHNPSSYDGTTGAWIPGSRTESTYHFYNKGFGNLKKATYSNLKTDLSNNPLALAELNKYKQKLLVTGGLYTGAGLLAIFSVISFINANNMPIPSKGISNTTVGLGIGTAVLSLAGYFTNKSKHKHLRNSITVYNQ